MRRSGSSLQAAPTRQATSQCGALLPFPPPRPPTNTSTPNAPSREPCPRSCGKRCPRVGPSTRTASGRISFPTCWVSSSRFPCCPAGFQVAAPFHQQLPAIWQKGSSQPWQGRPVPHRLHSRLRRCCRMARASLSAAERQRKLLPANEEAERFGNRRMAAIALVATTTMGVLPPCNNQLGPRHALSGAESANNFWPCERRYLRRVSAPLSAFAKRRQHV